MGIWERLSGKASGDNNFDLAQLAFEKDDLNLALSLLTKETQNCPQIVAAHLLTGKCFTKGHRFMQAIQVYSALIMHPHIRNNAELPMDTVDELLVEALLGWAAEIEREEFPEAKLKLFSKTVDFYGNCCGKRVVALTGLDEGLRRKHPVTEMFAAMIREAQ